MVAVGSGQPLRAFQAALKSMKEGEKATLQIKPECAKTLPTCHASSSQFC